MVSCWGGPRSLKWGCWESLESEQESTHSLFQNGQNFSFWIHVVVFPTLQAISHNESEMDSDITNPTQLVQQRHWHPQLLSVLSFNNSPMNLYTQPSHRLASLKNAIKCFHSEVKVQPGGAEGQQRRLSGVLKGWGL